MTPTPTPAPTEALQLPEATGRPEACSLTTKLWMWGFIPAFLIHDGEEAGYAVKHGGMEGFGVFQGTAETLAGMLFELTCSWVFILLATRSGRPGWQVRLFAAFIGAWTLHGVEHIVEAVFGHGYVIGSVTALPAVVVYGTLMFGVLYREQLLDRRWLAYSVLLGGLIATPFVGLAHVWGSLLG